ncbi:MAG: hypothetical protein IPO18_09265 [bacterium]|nr:hypothetical protein [bacterium]
MPTDNLQPSFDAFPWDDDETLLRAWRQRPDRHPVRRDAGMRELWQTGWMQPLADGDGFVPRQEPAAALAARARRGSATAWTTPTWRPTARRGSGWPVAARMLRPISASSIPVFAGSQVRSRRRLHAPLRPRTGGPARSRLFAPWKRRRRCCSRPGSSSGRTIRGRWSTWRLRGSGRWRRTRVARRPVSRRSGNAIGSAYSFTIRTHVHRFSRKPGCTREDAQRPRWRWLRRGAAWRPPLPS